MKGRLTGRIVAMKRDNDWVYVTLETAGAVLEADGVRLGTDSKASGAEITLRVKPIVGDHLKFGEPIYLAWSTGEQIIKEVHDV